MGVPEQGSETAALDTSVPHIARVYNYWLGGKDNFVPPPGPAGPLPGNLPADQRRRRVPPTARRVGWTGPIRAQRPRMLTGQTGQCDRGHERHGASPRNDAAGCGCRCTTGGSLWFTERLPSWGRYASGGIRV
ncbi:MAG: SAM-dependent methyltransferase [Micromonosporaceae bacterium]